MLEDGRLAALNVPKAEMPNDYAYWLLQAEPRPRSEVLNVAEWIAAEVRQMEAAMADTAATA